MTRKDLEKICRLCPRDCRSPRTPEEPGFCGADEGFSDFRLSAIHPHHGEERFISGSRGSGTLFFTGCSLKCCFCQNYAISHEQRGRRMTAEELVGQMEDLLGSGVHNLNLVTPSHYADRLPDLLDRLHQTRTWRIQPVPVIWNSSTYETPDSLRPLQNFVDIYLADMKFLDSGLSEDLTGCPDYGPIALEAIREMHRQQPGTVIDGQGILQKGLVIRHLVLPGCQEDSIRILDQLASFLPSDTPLSIMSQYHPRSHHPCEGRPSLARYLTDDEYLPVIGHARSLGFTRLLTQ